MTHPAHKDIKKFLEIDSYKGWGARKLVVHIQSSRNMASFSGF